MRAFFSNRWVILFLRLAIGGIFLAACLDKIAYPAKFALAVSNYRFLPDVLINLWALILPWVELVVAVLLIAGIWVEASALISGLLCFSFFIALSAALARGLDIGCGCFTLSETQSRISTLNLFRDAVLFAGSLWILFGYRGRLAVEAIWRRPNP